jgi:ribosome-associated protein
MSGERLSKSARKREAQAVRALADRLVELGPDELARVVEDADVLDAVRAAQGMPSHGAGRRQRQYIAKLLRGIDTDAITDALAQADAAPAEARRRFHAAERLRDALMRGGDPAEQLAAAGVTASADIDAALSELRSAHSDAGRKRAARRLFRALHEQIGAEDRAAGSG